MSTVAPSVRLNLMELEWNKSSQVSSMVRMICSPVHQEVTSQRVLPGLKSPEGVAVDWLAQNMYWTDSGSDTIEVSRLDGTNRKLLFDQDLIHPRAIVLDPVRGIMFWTDWNRDYPKVERAYMDGSERMKLVESNLGLPNGLVIDFDTYHVCWADAGIYPLPSSISCHVIASDVDITLILPVF